MNNERATYQIWTDGSYRQASRNVGVGWLIRYGGVEREGRNSIKALHGNDIPHGSDIAEIFGVVCALREIPTGVSIELKMDAQNVVEWINQQNIPLLAKENVPTLRMLFEDVIELRRRFEGFSVLCIGGKTYANLSKVHTLSRKASAPHL